MQLEQQLKNQRRAEEKWLEPSKKTFILANRLKSAFLSGSIEEKRTILLAVGLNLRLKDKKLLIEAKKPFSIIEKENGFPSWWTIVEEVRHFFAETKEAVPMMNQLKRLPCLRRLMSATMS